MHFVLFNFFKGAHVVCALACWLFVSAVLAPTQANPLWDDVSANATCSLPNSIGSDRNDAHDFGCCVLGCRDSFVVTYLVISIDVMNSGGKVYH